MPEVDAEGRKGAGLILKGFLAILFTIAQVCTSIGAVYAFAGPVVRSRALGVAETFVRQTMQVQMDDFGAQLEALTDAVKGLTDQQGTLVEGQDTETTRSVGEADALNWLVCREVATAQGQDLNTACGAAPQQ